MNKNVYNLAIEIAGRIFEGETKKMVIQYITKLKDTEIETFKDAAEIVSQAKRETSQIEVSQFDLKEFLQEILQPFQVTKIPDYLLKHPLSNAVVFRVAKSINSHCCVVFDDEERYVSSFNNTLSYKDYKKIQDTMSKEFHHNYPAKN